MTKRDDLIEPVVKWAGGKRQLLDRIIPMIPPHGRYYEPFVGGGAVLFKILPTNAKINDLNQNLCIMYRVIRDNTEDLIEELANHRCNNERYGKDYYLEVRKMDRDPDYNKKISNVEKAARLIYLNKVCFNGLYRENSQGYFNVPYGNNPRPMMFEPIVLKNMGEYLRDNDIIITNIDFEESVADAEEGDFVYFDPPYDAPDSLNFTDYQSNGFSRKDQMRLRDTVVDLTTRGVKCLISNSSTEYIKNIYGDERKFTIHTVGARRSINSVGSRRGLVNEVLIKNW